jgi:imidazolonepropionase-like amidohydrolase
MLTLEGGRIIDGTGGDPLPAATIRVVDDQIVSVAHEHNSRARQENQIDARGLTVLPGLIDLHSHMGVIDLGNVARLSPAMTAARLFENAALCLYSGHTTAREVAGADGALREVIEAGLISGPRLFPSGPLLSQTGGHGDHVASYATAHDIPAGMPGLAQLSLVCDGPDGARLAAREAFRRGATQLKVAISGGILGDGEGAKRVEFSVEELAPIVEEAKARSTYVTGHAHNTEAIRRGLAAGLECFEHGTFLDEETAELMARHGSALVPTLTAVHVMCESASEAGIGEREMRRLESVEQAMKNSVKLAVNAGIVIGSGTDLVGIGQNRRGLEIALKSEVLGPMSAIVSATQMNARILRVADHLGTIEEGKKADIIAVDGDPLTEPTLFDNPNRVVLVIKGGQVVKDIR